MKAEYLELAKAKIIIISLLIPVLRLLVTAEVGADIIIIISLLIPVLRLLMTAEVGQT